MSVFRRGAFTLAEVLITLGIIGVVAALTTPAIIQNSQNAKIGPQMAKIKTTLETAIQAICTDQEKYYLKDIINPEDITDLSLAGKIDAIAQNYMKARPSNATLPPVVDMTGAAYGNVVGSIYEMADKSAIVIPECKFGKEVVEEGGLPDCGGGAFLPGRRGGRMARGNPCGRNAGGAGRSGAKRRICLLAGQRRGDRPCFTDCGKRRSQMEPENKNPKMAFFSAFFPG